MPVMKALKSLSYDGVKYRVGDFFECDDRYIPLLVHAGIACAPEVKISEPVPVYQTRHMEAQRQGTVSSLRAEAEARGIHLPKGYIPKAQLLEIIAKAS